MNRRLFLMTGGAALAAQVPPSRQVVLGLIGAGTRGMQLLRILLGNPAVRIGALCETYEPRMFEAAALARSQGHRTRYYRLYRDLLADQSLDAVVIATPDFWHCRMTLDALEQSKDIYLEQPLCRTWQEGVELLAAHRRSKQIVQVGCQRRSSPVLAQLTGRIGTVRRVEARAAAPWLRPGVLRRGPVKLPDPLNFEDWQAAAEKHVAYSPDRFLNWRFYPEYGGGCIAGLGSQLLDGVQMVADPGYPVSVAAHGTRSRLADFDTMERAEVRVEYAGGAVATVTLDGASNSHQDVVRVEGLRGRIGIDAASAGDATANHLAQFLDCVQTRMAPSAPPQAVFPATLICQMANLSIANGRAMHWRPAEQEVS